MRASLFLVAALALAACSSPVASPNANPQTLNALSRMVPADPGVDRLTVVFSNYEDGSYLHIRALPFSCIVSVTPSDFNLNGLRSKTVTIDASTVDRCAHNTAEVDFAASFYEPVKQFRWEGSLDVWHNPEKSEWTAKIRGNGDRICPEPNGLEDGIKLQQNELIAFFWCG